MGQKKQTHEIPLGRIKAAIWANQTENQDVWFNVTVSRLYRDNGEWKDTSSFGRDDLPIVTKALDMAYSWIWRQHLKRRQARKDAA